MATNREETQCTCTVGERPSEAIAQIVRIFLSNSLNTADINLTPSERSRRAKERIRGREGGAGGRGDKSAL